MYFLKFTLIILFSSLLSGKESPHLFDQYHDSLCEVLVDTSNSIDDYFVEDNGTSISSTTSAEFSISFAKEKYLDMEKDVRFRLRLNLPKIEKNLRLIFEDENSDDLLYDGTTLDNTKLKDKRYYLRLEYFSYVKDTLNIRLGGGVRFRDGNIVPYLNINSKYELYNKHNHKSQLLNRFRYYSDEEIENNFEFNSLYAIDEAMYLTWNNNFYYSSENISETLFDDLIFVYIFNKKQQVNFGLGISSNIENFKKLDVEYYFLHSTFYHLFYKDWVYYEVSPSLLKRRINDFKTSYRFLVHFGIHFKS